MREKGMERFAVPQCEGCLDVVAGQIRDDHCAERSVPVASDLPDTATDACGPGLSDEEWATLAPFLPSERGRWSRPALDNRMFFTGMLHVLATGRPWRSMDARFGRWNSVYVRFQRWAVQGVWDRVLPTLVACGLTEHWPETADEGGLLRKTVIETAAMLRRERDQEPDGGIAGGWQESAGSRTRPAACEISAVAGTDDP